MSIKAVIFDVDGVIFDSEVLHKIAWEDVLSKYRIMLDENDYLEGIGISDKDFLEKLKKENKIPSDINTEILISQKIIKLLEISRNGVKPFPGISELIDTLSKKYLLAVASNSHKEFITNLLKNSGFSRFFSVVLGYQDISRPKPAPDIYIKCSKQLNVQCSSCCVVEDSPAGIRAAKNAGMHCIGISSIIERSLLSDADLIIDNVDINVIKTFLRSIK